ncbi:TIGR04141 family sporadically distributed protein [Thermobifida halotolerans]|uniref:TIGR04141 family sporadically distributed protein n=1 Tax=Thermobifida halotolerans TaxID=483545 RepID=A0A399FYQ2_9ACTN|nr:DUF6119 family protein [Thermobifida halotolerans]UOE19318.1 TIGR04141 family sporadically distributed protein [Thermobifida halotolerans]
MPYRSAAPRVREVTLYRLAGVAPTEQEMRDVFAIDETAQQNLNLRTTRIDDRPAVVLEGTRWGERPPDWLRDARTSTGLPLELTTRSPAVAVLVDVDGDVYAFSYGMGHWLIPYDRRDPDFGRLFAARALNPETVQTVHTRSLDSHGRYVNTTIIKGGSMRTYALRHERELVGRIRARCGIPGLTASRDGRTPRFAYCSDGIRTHLGVEPRDLVNDIRFIAAAIKEGTPHELFGDLEDQKEVRDSATKTRLWSLVGTESGGQSAGGGPEIAPPSDVLTVLGEACSFTLHLGEKLPAPDYETLSDLFADRLQSIQPETLETRLRRAEIRLYGDSDGREQIAVCRDLRPWIEATVHDGQKTYILREGHWYEYGKRFLDKVRTKVTELLEKGSSIEFPAWPRSDGKPASEGFYNEKTVPKSDSRFLCLDTDLASTPMHDGKGIELCDLLGPNDELVHVKQAAGASKLSHLFIQVRSAVESLQYEPEAREWFREQVAAIAPDRTPPVLPPKTVVFGIRLSAHSEVTVDTLYPMARVELYRTAVALERYGIDVQVVGIRHGT